MDERVERLDERVGGGEKDVHGAREDIREHHPEGEKGETPAEEPAPGKLRGAEMRHEVGHGGILNNGKIRMTIE